MKPEVKARNWEAANLEQLTERTSRGIINLITLIHFSPLKGLVETALS